MGKGDKKTRKGKIAMGSYGKTRPHDQKKTKPAEAAAPAEKKWLKAIQIKLGGFFHLVQIFYRLIIVFFQNLLSSRLRFLNQQILLYV